MDEKIVKAHKADKIYSDEPIDIVSTVIISEPLPRISSLPMSRKTFKGDAEKMFAIFKRNLPQGTRFELAKLFINDAENLYVGN